MEDILRIDIVSLFDLDFEEQSVSSLDDIMLARAHQDDYVSNLYADSFGWVFYDPSLDDRSIPGFRRFSFAAPKGFQNGRGVSILINPERGVGVCSVWQSFEGDADPLKIKQNSGNIFSESLKFLRALGLKVEESERHYPFIGIQVNTQDIARYCGDHAEELGRVFTGNYEWEDRARLEAYVLNNISSREYERLLLRWTEGFGVYGNVDTGRYEKSLFRAIQIFETCIAVRRLLRNITKGVDELSGKWLFPWRVNKQVQAFLETRYVLVISPPVTSVEAERLLRDAYRSFGIDSLVKSTQESCDFLERRFQWVKAQFLVGVAVITYILDKMHVLDKIFK